MKKFYFIVIKDGTNFRLMLTPTGSLMIAEKYQIVQMVKDYEEVYPQLNFFMAEFSDSSKIERSLLNLNKIFTN